MTESQDELYSEDLQVAAVPYADDIRPSLSHEVIATYIADAARSVSGVVDLHTSPWKGFSSRMRETHSQGVVVRDASPGSVDVEIHARVAWDVYIPDLAGKVEEAVRERAVALLSINLNSVTLFIDEIAGPMEVGSPEEG
ncbi:MAG TPA: Asp23/Gls24 family envelope stress response protein [Thermoleophilia bacterium]|nr:Asp23/Gls24 family envelope stress response protein [Thermoleophilia bacterium]